MTASAPKAVAGVSQVVSDVSSVGSDMDAPAPGGDPFGIFSEGYDAMNYGLANDSALYEYDSSAYNYCLNVSDVFEVFALSNMSLSVRVRRVYNGGCQ